MYNKYSRQPTADSRQPTADSQPYSRSYLFVCNQNPFKTVSGAHQRTNLLCRMLATIGHVDVVCLEQDICTSNIENCSFIQISTATDNIQKKGANILLKFLFLFIPPVIVKVVNYTAKVFNTLTMGVIGKQNPIIKKNIQRLLEKNKYDLIVIRYIRNLIIFGIKANKKVVIDIDDLPEQSYQTALRKDKKGIKQIVAKYYFQVCKNSARFYTKNIVKKVKYVYLPTELQCAMFSNAIYLPNIPYSFRDILDEDVNSINVFRLLFVGLIEWGPNCNGLEYFFTNIMPKIQENISNICVHIVGSISDGRKQEWIRKYKNIKIRGFVDDLREEYKNSNVIIAPIYQGAGTNIKVLEAMYLGKCCVISEYAGRGFEKTLKDGENVFIAKNDTDFANKIIRILLDTDLAKSMGLKAKETINNNYSYQNNLSIVQKSIRDLS